MSALKLVGEFLIIDAELMYDRGMQVVDADRIVRDVVSTTKRDRST